MMQLYIIFVHYYLYFHHFHLQQSDRGIMQQILKEGSKQMHHLISVLNLSQKEVLRQI